MRLQQDKILLDLSGVTTIDSSGIGELVGSYTTVTNKRRQAQTAAPSRQAQRAAPRDAAHHRVRGLRERAGSDRELLTGTAALRCPAGVFIAAPRSFENRIARIRRAGISDGSLAVHERCRRAGYPVRGAVSLAAFLRSRTSAGPASASAARSSSPSRSARPISGRARRPAS